MSRLSLPRRAHLAVLAIAGVLAACSASAPAEEADEASEDELSTRGAVVDPTMPDVDAIAYELDLAVDDTARRESYNATLKGTYIATRDLDELELDLEGTEIDDVKVGRRNAEHRREGSKLFVKLPAPVAKGKAFTTRIAYHGAVAQADGANPNDFAAFGGFMVKQRNAEGRRIFTSLSWPSKARRWMPLRDHPRDGAMFAAKVTFPEKYTVLANGKKLGVTDNGDGTRTWRFESSSPMPTYDFHVSAYDAWNVKEGRASSGVPIATYRYARSEQNAEQVYRDLPRALDFYESAFGKYRFGTAAFIEEPIFGGGMEHASVVSMDETLFDGDPESRETAFHELAHHWSGNLARIRTWNDFWLSEGFTEYLTARFIADHDGPEAEKRVLRGYMTAAFGAERYSAHPLRPADPEIDVLTIFDATSYQKGALVMRMLEGIVGRETMTSFLRGWFDRHAFGAVTTEDLKKELEQASGKDLGAFFAGFVYGSYHPEIKVTLAGAAGRQEIVVEQVQTKGPEAGFAFPLVVELASASGDKRRVTVDVRGRTARAPVPAGFEATALVVDPDEHLLGSVACDANRACKEGFRCGSAAVAMCLPR